MNGKPGSNSISHGSLGSAGLLLALVALLGLAAPAAFGDQGAAADEVSETSAAGKDDASKTASEKEKPVPTLPEIVVTATPIVDDTRIDQYARRVAVVTNQQLTDLNAQDLATALRRVPGVTISRYNLVGSYGGGDGGAVYVRAQGSGRPGAETTTLFDGVPRYAGVWTHPLLDELAVESVDRVEILRSAQPVLVGNMAFAAVNLVPVRKTAPGFQTRLSGSLGSYDTRSVALEHGGRKGICDYYVTASRRESDGHRANAGGLVRALYGRAGFSLSDDWELDLQATHSDGSVQDPGPEGEPAPPVVPTFGTDTELYIASVPHQAGPLQGEIKLYYELGHIDWQQWQPASEAPPRPAEAFRSLTRWENYGLHLRETWSPWTGMEWVGGYDQDLTDASTEEERAETVPLGSYLFRNQAPYVMVSQRFEGSVAITPSAGLRYNRSRYFGDDWGWQAGLTAETGEVKLYANHAHAFNVPGMYTAVLESGWGRPEEWKSLRAEKLDHFEIGASAPLFSRTHLTLSAYYDEARDALRFVPPPPPPPSFANSGAYISRGLEGSVSYSPDPRLALFGGVTLLSTTPAEVPNAPSWDYTAGVTAQVLSRCKLTADASWIDAQYVLNPRFAAPTDWANTDLARVDGHFLLNGRIGYQLPPRWSRARTELYLAGENLTDERYSYRPGYPMPRATWSTGVMLDLE